MAPTAGEIDISLSFEDDEQVEVLLYSGVVEGFECHAAGERAVADDGDDATTVFALTGGDGHAEGGG